MITLHLVLQVAALICLALAAFNVPTRTVSIGWAGMTLWLLADLLAGGTVLLR